MTGLSLFRQCIHFILLPSWAVISWAQASPLTCRPLEGLPLSQPYPPAYLQTVRLPSCSQYTCSCCNITHALAIHRALSEAREDPSFSRTCLAWQTRMACRVCDPEVGVGLKPAVCRSVCDDWWAACKGEYFTFESPSLSAFDPTMLPCAAGGGAARPGAPGRAGGSSGSSGSGSGGGSAGAATSTASPLLCSRLSDVVKDGEGLCREAGLEVAEAGSEAVGSACFDGSSSYSTDFCERPPPRRQAQQQRQGVGGRAGEGAGGRAGEGAGGRAGEVAGELEPLSPAVYFVAAVVILSLAWLGYTTRLSIRADEEAAMQQLHHRQLHHRKDY